MLKIMILISLVFISIKINDIKADYDYIRQSNDMILQTVSDMFVKMD